jgi:hypothetical protein
MREIPGFPEYRINKQGVVFMRAQTALDFNGHVIVRMRGRWHRIEDLMADTYLEPVSGERVILHKDKNRRNLALDNLEVTTKDE